MPDNTTTLSYLVKATALLAFTYMLWRLWLYVPNNAYVYNLYAALISAIVGVGLFMFDFIYRLKDRFVGWSFLLGVGLLSLIIGILFVFFADGTIYNPLTLPTVAVAQLGFGLIIIVESFLVRRSCVPGSHGINRETVTPILIRTTALFTIMWGLYHLVWVIRIFDFYGVSLDLQWPLLLLGLGCILIGSAHIIYQEHQKHQPHFIMRKIPLLFSFFMFVLSLFIINIYLVAPDSLIFPISLALGIALLVESFCIFQFPTKIR